MFSPKVKVGVFGERVIVGGTTAGERERKRERERLNQLCQ